MLFTIDIDATIATDRNGYAKYLNRELQLGIDESLIEQLESFESFHALTAVQDYLQQPDQCNRYWEMYESLQHNPEIQKQLVPIPGALQALHEIAQLGTIIYATCRHSEAKTITQEWLARYNFPSPEQVMTCPRYYDKYLIANEQAKPREKVILIDDHAKEMVEAFFVLAKKHMEIAVYLKRRLAIIAFDCTEPPTFRFKIPFPVLALPSWMPEDLARMQLEHAQYQANENRGTLSRTRQSTL